MWLSKASLVVLISVFITQSLWASVPSYDMHRTQMDKKIKFCSKDPMVFAKEILDLELAGLRWRSAKASCFESLKLKYVHALKVPDAHAEGLVRVKKNSLKIETPKYDEAFYSYKVAFSVEDEQGKRVRSKFSFMLNTDLGGKKPKQGCVLISSTPNLAYVSDACL